MYGSFRFYIDSFAGVNTKESILRFYELFNDFFSVDFEYIYYRQLDAESDRWLKDLEFTYNKSGKERFLAEEIVPGAIGSQGDASVPFIGTTCHTSPDKLYGKARVEFQMTDSARIVLRVDFCGKYLKQMISGSDYKNIVIQIMEAGFHVNNSLFHIYSSQNTATALDGGQIGSWGRLSDRRLINAYREHALNGCQDHLMGVFLANSVLLNMADNGIRQEIDAIIGEGHTFVYKDIFGFFLPDKDWSSSIYHIKDYEKIRKIRALFP